MVPSGVRPEVPGAARSRLSDAHPPPAPDPPPHPTVFDSIAQRFASLFAGLGRTGKLTDKNIEDGIEQVRTALLEADVSLDVVRGFVERVRGRAVGLERLAGIAPADQFVKVVHDEMVALLGGEPVRIRWNDRGGPTIFMMVGLQGTGKTTTCGKLALHLRKKEGKKPLLVAADVKRPAAVEQLKIIGRQVDVPVYSEEGGRPEKICARGVQQAMANGQRRRHPRHRRPPPHRRRVDGRARGHPHQDQAARDLARRRRAGRPGRGALGDRVRPSALRHGADPLQDRRRRARGRRAHAARGDRQADPLRRDRGEARGARALRAVAHGDPHPRHGRRRRPRREGAGGRRPGRGRGRRRADVQGHVEPRGLPRVPPPVEGHGRQDRAD